MRRFLARAPSIGFLITLGEGRCVKSCACFFCLHQSLPSWSSARAHILQHQAHTSLKARRLGVGRGRAEIGPKLLWDACFSRKRHA